MRVIVSATIYLMIVFSSTASLADDLLDFSDPCTDAQNKFSTSSSALHARADQILAKWDSAVDPPDEVKPFYVEAVQAAIYSNWLKDPAVAPLIATYKKADAKFDAKSFFMTQIYLSVVTPEQEQTYVRELFKADYAINIRPKIIAERNDLENTITTQKSELDKDCKQDLVDKILRSTYGNGMLFVTANTDAAKQEHGVLAQSFRLTSGISIADIEKNGILGGDGSEIRKIAEGAGAATNNVRDLLNTLNKTISNTKMPAVSVGGNGGVQLPDGTHIPLPNPNPIPLPPIRIGGFHFP